ncbi:hypothetical protein JCM24511_04274 [Saitozyma sp. JCM 24511]|nr:hypothetical protein JCM24511_04274 [Saitozyma sp. JCM 24511]
MFSLRFQQLLDDLELALEFGRLILAYLDDIRNDPKTLGAFQAFSASPQPSIQLNKAESQTIALQEAKECGIPLLDSRIGSTVVRELFLEVKIAAEGALIPKSATSPAPSAALDDTLMARQIKFGGLGILPFKALASLAYAAAYMASDALLAPLLGHDVNTVNHTILS